MWDRVAWLACATVVFVMSLTPSHLRGHQRYWLCETGRGHGSTRAANPACCATLLGEAVFQNGSARLVSVWDLQTDHGIAQDAHLVDRIADVRELHLDGRDIAAIDEAAHVGEITGIIFGCDSTKIAIVIGVRWWRGDAHDFHRSFGQAERLHAFPAAAACHECVVQQRRLELIAIANRIPQAEAERDAPDMVILDMMMPKRSGFLVLERLIRLAKAHARIQLAGL